MAAPERLSRPHAVLFACGMNAVRSPMAAALLQQMFGTTVYVGSAGVQKRELDPFAVAAMEEVGIDISRHKPITFEELDDLEGLNFDLIVTLSPPAHHKALELTRAAPVEVEYWPTVDPTEALRFFVICFCKTTFGAMFSTASVVCRARNAFSGVLF